MSKNNRIRVGVVLTQDNEILIVRMHREESKDIFVLPGGGVELGEDIFEAAIRETKEETNIDITIKKILYLKSLYTENERAIEIILLGEIIGGDLKKGFDPEDKSKNVLKEVRFINGGELEDLNFHPKQLRSILKKDLEEGFRRECQYLGNFRYPEA